MIAKKVCIREKFRDYLYNLEAMTRKEAKHLWRQSIKDAWNNKCAYCGQPPIDDRSLTVDHVKPKAKGGEDRTSNCVPACSKCNHSKGSEEWLKWFSRQPFYNEVAVKRIQIWIEEGLVVDENFDIMSNTKSLPNSGDIYDVSLTMTEVFG